MPDYDSPFFITNDRADIDQEAIEDGTATVWLLSDDAKLRRSPERQYCGNYLTYGDSGAATYRHNADTHDLIAAGPAQHRDMTSSFPMVKTQTKAQARGDRQLLDVQDQDVRITTRLVNIPAERVTLAKAGMRLQIKGTHWAPTCDQWHYARILTAQPMPHAAGDLYDIDLELVMGMPVESSLSPGPAEPPFTGNAFAGAQYSTGFMDPIYWEYDGDSPTTGWYANPTVGPLSYIDDGGGKFTRLTTSVAMTVRVHAAAWAAMVTGDDGGGMEITATSSVTGLIGAASSSRVGFGFFNDQCVIDVHDYTMVAGEIITFGGTLTGAVGGAGWGNSGVNTSFIRIGRGAHFWGAGGDTELWVGP